MRIVNTHLHDRASAQENTIAVMVDRATLAKRRWRAVASDGREFGFDLDHALAHGDVIFRDEVVSYAVFQNPEPVLEIALPATAQAIATLAWQIGNLHFPVEVTHESIRTNNDSALRQMLDREHIVYTQTEAVFRPIPASAHGHHHHH